MVAGPGFMEITLWMLLSGGFFGGGVMGLPPGERDAVLVQCPSPEVIIYSEWSSRGEGKPGAAGVDGFAADPEVLAFLTAVEKAIDDTIEANAGAGPEKVFSDNIPPLVKILLNRPGCLYVDLDPKTARAVLADPPELPPFTPSFFGMLPAFQATMVVNGGDQADAIAKHLQAMCDLLPESERVENLQHQKFPIPMEGAHLTLHRHEGHFILGWGKDTVEAAVKGLKGDAKGLKDNPRFAASMEKVLLERTGSVAWLDLKSLVKKSVEGLGPQGLVVAAVLQQLGADTIESLALCSGVVEGQIHSRGFLHTDGKTEGILSLAGGRALKAEDFSQIPADADLVLGFSLDAPQVLATAQKIVGQADPQSKEVFDQIIKELETELELTFEEDIFQAFGDVWTIYDSPASGGVLLTAPVLGLEVRDHEKAKLAFEKLMGVLKLALPGETRSGPFGRAVHLTNKTFLDHEVYFINQIGVDNPFAVTFTLTEKQLLISPHPQQIKSHLRFLQSDEKRFSEVYEEKIKHEGGELFAVSYTQPELFSRYLVSISPMIGTAMFGEIQRQMPGLDVFSLPSARAILPYLGEGLITKERTAEGILWNYRHGIPIPGASAQLMTLPAFLGFRLFRFRRMEAPRAAPAIQINQHRPKPPVGTLRERNTPRATLLG